MPIPTENVGSLPRPLKLQEAIAAYDKGEITKEQLGAEQDAAARDSVERMEATGAGLVTDGEQRASSFATYPLTDTLAGIHTCPGGDNDSVHSKEVDYAELLPSLFQMNAGYFLTQLASEDDKERVYKLIGDNIRADANGVKQVAEDLVIAAKYIPTDQLGATADCGFSPFSIDLKPKHGSPDFARDIAFQKIRAR